MGEISSKKKITRKDLRGFALEILGFFEREGINSGTSLEDKVGGVFNAKKGKIYVKKSSRWSNREYKISYVVDGRTPIEVNMDINLNFYTLTIECSEEIEGYDVLKEVVGEFIQEKMLRYSWESVREELGALRG